MRNLLFLVVFICIHAVSFSQYQSVFGTNSTAWNIKNEQLFGTYYDSVVTVSDTLAGGVMYKKVNFYTIWNHVPSFLYSFLLREDTVAGKAWCRDFTGPETLWYDISLQTGDSFAGHAVDSVYYVNNKKHVRFNTFIEYGIAKKTFVEGVGANDGIPCAGGLSPVFLCQHKDDTVHFVNNTGTYAGLCRIETNGPNGIQEPLPHMVKVEVFPNPAADQVRYEIHGNIQAGQAEITLVDIYGREVYREQIPVEDEVQYTLSVAVFPPGMYVLQVERDNKTIARQKLMIQR